MSYQNGKIYRVDCLTTGKTYIGSTIKKTLAMRQSQHVYAFKKYKTGEFHRLTSFEILENDNYQFTLIEEYPCNSKEELFSREGYYIRSMDCVNKIIPDRTLAQYNIDEKEKISNKKKEHYQENKDRVKEKSKKRYETNRDDINKKRREQYAIRKSNHSV